jgi:pimeloyl-ACP methyl ester carboxylesterase
VAFAERVAPQWLEERAFALWCRPLKTASAWGPLLSTARRFTLEAGDVALTAWEWNVEGPQGTALLVHGWSGNAGQMSSFVSPLVERGFHVVAVDLPAHGESPGNFATLVLLARSLELVGKRLLPRVVIAHSMGGTATTYALTKGLSLERMVLLASPVQLPPYLKHFGEEFGLSEAMQDRLLARIEKVVGLRISELDLRPHVKTLVHVSALVVHDRGDRVVPVAASRELVSAWPGARLIETEGLSHDKVRRDAKVVSSAVAFVSGQPLLETTHLVAEALMTAPLSLPLASTTPPTGTSSRYAPEAGVATGAESQASTVSSHVKVTIETELSGAVSGAVKDAAAAPRE